MGLLKSIGRAIGSAVRTITGTDDTLRSVERSANDAHQVMHNPLIHNTLNEMKTAATDVKLAAADIKANIALTSNAVIQTATHTTHVIDTVSDVVGSAAQSSVTYSLVRGAITLTQCAIQKRMPDRYDARFVVLSFFLLCVRSPSWIYFCLSLICRDVARGAVAGGVIKLAVIATNPATGIALTAIYAIYSIGSSIRTHRKRKEAQDKAKKTEIHSLETSDLSK